MEKNSTITARIEKKVKKLYFLVRVYVLSIEGL